MLHKTNKIASESSFRLLLPHSHDRLPVYMDNNLAADLFNDLYASSDRVH